MDISSSNTPTGSKAGPAKRNRIPLSCASCRVRKLRCDRHQPCHNCVMRGSSNLCLYAARPSRRQKVTSSAPQSESRATSPVLGRLFDGLFYRSGSHWDSVLSELATLSIQDDLHKDTSNHPQRTAPGLNDELLAVIPSRSAADRLISAFFAPHSFVGPTRSLLYSIFSLAMKFLPEAKDNSGMSEALGKLYHNKSGQCLERIKTDQTTLQTLQAMIAHGVFGFSHHEEWGAGLITHIGSIVRLAMRLGLHRDPSHFSNLSPFEGEMRRRIWTTIDQIDCLSSFHLGIPTAIRSEDSDTDPPRNLLDTDMEEGMSELPPSRPFSTSVPIGYSLAKLKLSRVMRRVVEFLNSVQQQPYERVLQLDIDLMEAYQSIPPHLQLNNWHDAPNNPAYVMVQKVQLDTLYHQAVTALHRKYLQEARKDPTFALSQQRSIDSSMTLLRHQATIYREAQPGGCFSNFHGYTITPDSANFSLAAMVLCLYLQYWTRTDREVPSHTEARVQDIFQALDTSRQIWNNLAGENREAGKVGLVLDTMLELLRPNLGLADRLAPAVDVAVSVDGERGLRQDPTRSGQSAAIPDVHLYTNEDGAKDSNMDMVDLNWDAWDSFVQAGDFETAYESLLGQDSTFPIEDLLDLSTSSPA
ncbi:hypothetical protein CNMCM6936_003703 [Aspergillus lentulus]|uniref:Zn(2)-C6 fungal-type domain-containing protein n=1 Tax=Aspergillus lentulus TaxID=293939 RepID=A0AAN6BPZ4_ASPLE|nr:hypothetical protein CNMCM6069_004724 [Aspergillus lentulus]KAF4168108.1 hypothetical protein CNMCM6936_003703 [Aspergillus lentulus]KAF4178171.1 hypothetical protein CNMCM8060_004754 [Aspergillus lentulus]KAF4183733.1 hypothetical protein CNMCM7927_008860 [Aspergillus lentulus]KAF4195470.1 hypothetical protein CNMCM8694_006273 [Aspergillus lentulus]